MAIRLGAHISSAGGVDQAAERAHALGCQTLQIFTASPRQWHAAPLPAARAAALRRLRQQYRLDPLVVHANYLINLAGANPDFHRRSLAAFRGELERAAAIGADYLVLHPGSGALARCLESLRQAAEGFVWGPLTLLIENTAGGGAHLGGDFGAVAALLDGLAGLPVGACIDTCHAWVAGYDLATPKGYQAALAQLDEQIGLARIPVFHANDAMAERGSHRDRHQHIGAGQLGRATFRRLLRDPRLQGKAFILETPVDGPDDQARDLAALRHLAQAPASTRKRRKSAQNKAQ
ncbi:MAG TPA: deoxyribonuclease IV [Terriglobales bacterium]|nr:deoxyribonuclease IV [Terriglobales bacterium]